MNTIKISIDRFYPEIFKFNNKFPPKMERGKNKFIDRELFQLKGNDIE